MMRRALGPFLVVVVVILGAAFWIGPNSTTGQDRTDERLDSPETQVADQADEITSLKRRVKALETAGKDDKTEESGALAGANGDANTISGSGIGVTDEFILSVGRYKVTAVVEAADFDGFSVFIYPPEGSEDLLFNEIIEDAGTWTGSAVY
jgi:hypothetical protein